MNRSSSDQAFKIFDDVLTADENAIWEQFEQSCGQDADLRAAVRALYDADKAFSGTVDKTVDERALHLRTQFAKEMISKE